MYVVTILFAEDTAPTGTLIELAAAANGSNGGRGIFQKSLSAADLAKKFVAVSDAIKRGQTLSSLH